jgi:D-alanyl-D-alanine-carboxypeptidase/D-alanyl-D-alanine-endopeptidase
MVARGEVAFDDPVSKHLPRTMTLRERGRPITLLDLANYNSGLAKLPDNIAAEWWTNPNPFAHYTVDKLRDFLSSYEPQYSPGTHFEYSSLGFGLLGMALSGRAGKSYEELLIERVCDPLGLAHTRITLSADLKRHLAQAHDLALRPTPLWDFLSPLQGAGAVRASVRDVTMFLKACIGIVHVPLSGLLARLVQTRSATSLAGTDSGLGWFISSKGEEEIAWKSGLTGGFNSFLGFSIRRRRGAFVFSNFLWPPVDLGITAMGLKLISPGFDPGDLGLLYS